MKTMILSAAALIAVATVANAQSRNNNTMGGWGSGAQSSTMGSGRGSTWQVPQGRDFGGYHTTPGSALTGSSSRAPRQPLRH